MTDKYIVLFFRYLYKFLRLNIAEEYLVNKGIVHIDDENLMCDEEKLCRKYSKYFYLLNEINMDNLSAEEISFLNSISIDSEINPTIENFLTNTYKKVLFSNSTGEKKYYGPHSSRFEASDDVIAIGFKRNEFGFGNGSLLEYDDTEKNNSIIDDVLKVIKDKSTLNIAILKYNELFEKMKNNSIK